MDRRDFLRTAGLTGAACIAPTWLSGGLQVWAAPTGDGEPADPSYRWDRILVLVELSGGNDGLNTVVSHRDDAYYRLRPKIAVPKKETIRLDDERGLHPSLAPFGETWKRGDLAVVQGVGYPDPNRSHFRSIEIWETGSDSDEFRSRGWLSSLLTRATLPTEHAADGIVVGGSDPGPLAGKGLRTITMSEPSQFIARAKALPEAAAKGIAPALRHLMEVREQTRRAAKIIEERLAGTRAPAGFPRTKIGQQFSVAARLLTSGVPTRVVKLNHGGFDTHTNQVGQHTRLLDQLGKGFAAFEKSMRQAGLWDRVLVMTYSEFGRRAAENGSGGTDHGTAAPHFVAGGSVKGGLYGEAPSLENLQGGDLRHTVDYRRLYASVAEEWWKLPKAWVEGGKFDSVGFIDRPSEAKL
ncbi:MAG: DUF1501 domain-containing protein [Planctomycetota bacterium]